MAGSTPAAPLTELPPGGAVSVHRVIAHRDIAQQLVDDLIARANALAVNDSTNEATDGSMRCRAPRRSGGRAFSDL